MHIGTALISTAFTLFLPILFSAGNLFRWVDEEGVVHMTDTLSQVPPQYRGQVDLRAIEAAGAARLQAPPDSAGRSAATEPALKHFEVSYQAFEGASRRIIIPVTFNDSVKADLLLDTGSPGLMISPDIAKRLGLLEEEEAQLKVRAAGIGGSAPAVLAVVDSVQVGEARSEFLPALITKIPSSEFEGLVGMDFMANYKITIDINDSVVVFDELPADANKPGGHDEAWWRSNFRKFGQLRDEWAGYIESIDKLPLTSSERERRSRIARNQHGQAADLCRKLERYARDNAVPASWRH